MRRYETFIILDPDLSAEQRAPVLDRVNELVGQFKGLMVELDEWGNRKLAYLVKKKARGYYVRFDYCGPSDLVSELERNFRIDDRVMKYMTVLLDREPDIEAVKAQMAAAEQQKQEAAQAAAEAEARKAAEAEQAAAPAAETQTPAAEGAAPAEAEAPSEAAEAAEAPAESSETQKEVQ